jgi:peptidyl-prolyl cis-trans isomerase C
MRSSKLESRPATAPVRHPLQIVLLALAAIGLLASCATKGTPPAVVPESATTTSSTDQPQAVNPFANGQAPPRVNADEIVRRMDFWLSVTVPPPDNKEGPAVFESSGYALSQAEYDEGLKGYLAGRDKTGELEAAYRQELTEQFLILRWLEESGAAEDPQFRIAARRALRERLVSLALEQETSRSTITDEQAREVYEKRIDMYRMPEMVEVRIIQVASESEAQRILERLRGGESFATLAATESKHESRVRLGRLEPFARGSYSKDFEEKAFALAPGETGMVTTPAGVFLIQKIANIPSASVPFEEVREIIRAELQQAYIKDRMKTFLDGKR